MLRLKTKLIIAAAALAVLAAPISYALARRAPPAEKFIEPDMIALRAGAVTYRPAGDYTRAAKQANAPLKTQQLARGLRIMKHQVTRSEYRRCVEDANCPSIDPSPSLPTDRPMVGVSWQDAVAYARWLSHKTGKRYRLPTDSEWAFAAGSRFRDEGWPDFDSADPAKRWLAQYEREAEEPVDGEPRAVGSFGGNENGLLDVAGNVWEWTDTCFVRIALDAAGHEVSTTKNCGVRVVEGRHRTYVTDFVRDARAGGCAVGTPPANLGFRLVRED